MRSKFKWKRQAFNLEKENDKLKRQVSAPNNLKKAYDNALHKIENKLIKRQFEIFLLTVNGLSSKEIEEEMNISAGTINNHIAEIMTRLNVEKRSYFSGILLTELKRSFK